MKRFMSLAVILVVVSLFFGCKQDDKKFTGSESTGETVKITPESVKESMKNNNGMTR